ncbi:hypothetical protein BDV93DRAFT_582342 [Ceratobasidium sp. AG-I]|nr:hypothetical protein BDV93DRAFT_582342 [Ceratobasidium sp. AG-I]
MAKGKTLNPADAHRKAQRAKEVKKNKENRSKARETATLKKDTSGIETEIHELESLEEAKLDQSQKARLKELRAEVERVRKIKQDYVAAHPEQAHLVRGLEQRPRRQQDGGGAPSTSGITPAARSLFGKNGLPIHPERSLYYDPVMNPYGMAPPGMPYAERPLLPHEIEEDRLKFQAPLQVDSPNVDSAMNSASDDSEEAHTDESESDDDDIALPAGPPPDDSKEASDSSSEGSDDDIPMPPGPPPPKAAPPLPQGGIPPQSYPMGVPYGTQFPPFPPTIPQYTPMALHVPPPPPGLPVAMHPGYPPPFIQGMQPYPQQGRGLRSPHDRQQMEAARAIQDPMSDIPHVTFQAHQAQRHQLPLPPSTGSGSQLPQSGLPPRPGVTSQAAASATIFAEPELRDFKKEATAFVPASMRRAAKKGPSTSNNPSGLRIDAAPDDKDDSGSSVEPRKDLMSVLGNHLGVSDKLGASAKPKGGQGKDDYDKFLAEVGSFL